MMAGFIVSRFTALLCVCSLSLVATKSFSQTLVWLGMTENANVSTAWDVSDNGVVVGWVQIPTSNNATQVLAVRWRQEGESWIIEELGTLGGPGSQAYSISADGSVVIGWAFDEYEQQSAFRWTNGNMQQLDPLYDPSVAYGVSTDGSIVVGHTSDWHGWRACAWRNGNLEVIGAGGNIWSQAQDVSTDGNIVVGWSNHISLGYGFSNPVPVRWERSSGNWRMEYIAGASIGEAYGVSADGSVVVGYIRNESGHNRAFRWQNGSIQILDTLDGNESEARDISANGDFVVGYATNTAGAWRAVRWSAAGIEDLNVTYANLLNGSELNLASAISPNGRYIAGYGFNIATWRLEAFLLDTFEACVSHSGDVDNNGCVDDADLLAVLLAFGSSSSDIGRADVNCDRVVDDADLLIVLFNFGSGC
jgi:probable HAF family extracellular repeat protein